MRSLELHSVADPRAPQPRRQQPLNRRIASLFHFSRSRRTLTLVDQAIVSGSNFITGVILVRGLGLVEFGRFTIAYAILLLANSVQLSFISSPMITLAALCAA